MAVWLLQRRSAKPCGPSWMRGGGRLIDVICWCCKAVMAIAAQFGVALAALEGVPAARACPALAMLTTMQHRASSPDAAELTLAPAV